MARLGDTPPSPQDLLKKVVLQQCLALLVPENKAWRQALSVPPPHSSTLRPLCHHHLPWGPKHGNLDKAVECRLGVGRVRYGRPSRVHPDSSLRSKLLLSLWALSAQRRLRARTEPDGAGGTGSRCPAHSQARESFSPLRTGLSALKAVSLSSQKDRKRFQVGSPSPGWQRISHKSSIAPSATGTSWEAASTEERDWAAGQDPQASLEPRATSSASGIGFLKCHILVETN